MRGFLGHANYKSIDLPKFQRSLDSLDHRGPDSTGFYHKNNVSLGFKRLSTRDLSPAGDQPMLNKSQDAVIVFNGEIYNSHYLSDIIAEHNIRL